MSTQKYFDILGIPPTKNEQVIKRAYRKKAMKYHPDRNPSKATKDKFIEITEAYDRILMILEKTKNTSHSRYSQHAKPTNPSSRKAHTRRSNHSRTQYDTQQSRSSTQEKVKSEHEQRIKEARQRYENLKRKEALENERYYQNITTGKNWRRFKIIVFLCTLISFLVILDSRYFSSNTIPSAIVSKNIQPILGRNSNANALYVAFENGQEAWVARNFIARSMNNFTYLERTPIFKEIKYVKFYEHDRWYYYTPDFSQSSTFPLIPLILFIPLFTFFIKGRTIYFSFLYHASTKILPIVLIVFLYSNDRWAHLLTLGMLP